MRLIESCAGIVDRIDLGTALQEPLGRTRALVESRGRHRVRRLRLVEAQGIVAQQTGDDDAALRGHHEAGIRATASDPVNKRRHLIRATTKMRQSSDRLYQSAPASVFIILYPTPGSVKMYFGLPASSPSLRRSLLS